VFHGKLHFSSNRAMVWLTDDPYCYRLLNFDALSGPRACQTWPRRPCPDTTLLPAVFERLRMLRTVDDNIYLRSGSLNIFNGMVGLEFSGSDTYNMGFREFLDRDAQFLFGLQCAV
jgi:hypothetical protein